MSKKTIIGGNGAEGSNSNAVFKTLFDQDEFTYEDAGDFEALLDGLVGGKYVKIVLPVSNSIIGAVEPAMKAYNRVLQAGAELTEEQNYDRPIHHALICGPVASMESITKIFCYPVAANQCRKKLDELGLEEKFHVDTYGAVVDVVAKNAADEAAIGPIEAAEEQGGKILIENLSDDPNNKTLFKIISLA